MKRFVIAAALLVLGLSLVWILARGRMQPARSALTIGNQVLQVEAARTPAQLTQGLGDRDAIGSDGLLFILPQRQVPQFWMQGMRFGLDFVWIDSGKVIALTPNVPAQPGVAASELKIYSPGMMATQVLELPLGDIARRGIKVGDAVSIND